MQYSPFPPAPLTVGGSVIERVVTYKLLGIYIYLWWSFMECPHRAHNQKGQQAFVRIARA